MLVQIIGIIIFVDITAVVTDYFAISQPQPLNKQQKISVLKDGLFLLFSQSFQFHLLLVFFIHSCKV